MRNSFSDCKWCSLLVVVWLCIGRTQCCTIAMLPGVESQLDIVTLRVRRRIIERVQMSRNSRVHMLHALDALVFAKLAAVSLSCTSLMITRVDPYVVARCAITSPNKGE
ncbi:hypothetical protein BJ138DRAFT_1163344 [Hygrophoropsis aurantiaca]|uniref:Uncharacterized protein n=1 Tax=Hygrophoropsis aurantiaca TaxID=72124 RepID=A0ACB7ZYL9_9AGAM|nr:hypothetical protein BJ138DRAFT_1163344 [Hygrophoropsis aurantiaca]